MSKPVTAGIFWLIDSRVYGLKEHLDADENSLQGKIDSNFEHWDVWENTPDRLGLPHVIRSLEYFDTSRGRVVYDIVKRKHIVYCDRLLLKAEIKALILDFFDLQAQATLWKSDPHYATDRDEIDAMW